MPRTRARTRSSRIVALLTAALLAVTLPVLVPATAAAAPTPGLVVTVAGSLQSELGCPGDWDPACPATTLSWDESTQRYRGTFDVPAGSYEYKIAIGGNWDENYGAGGAANGANIPLVTEATVRVSFAYDSQTHLADVSFAPGGITGGQQRALAGTSLREDLTREQFYFVMADRFANGDPTNDAGGLSGDRLSTGFDPTDKGFYHGGDIKGIASKLDYLQGMGVTAIWMTPSFKNKPVQGTPGTESAGYHGYWITDFTQIDPHLGTNAELTALIGKAHKRGMKVFFDIITNHTADVIDYRQGRYDYISKQDVPYRDAAGTDFDDRDYVSRPAADFPALTAEASFPYTPYYPTAADESAKVPAALNNLTWYHNRGNSTFAGESNVYGDFVGLDDLFTEQPVVRDEMIDIYKTWASFGVDGFRIDTVKHVNMEFWQKFSPDVLAAAHQAGKKDFFMFGEVYDANPAFMSQYTTTGKLPATLDFGFQSAATNFGLGRPTTGLRDLFAGDDYYTDTDSNVYQSPTFLGNHDMGRIGYFLSKDSPASEDELLQRDELAHALMYTSRGQPVVYYGDEQGFTGSGGDQLARQDMFPTQVADYQDDNQLGTDASPAADHFDSNHPLYREIAALAKLRQQNPAIADGAQIHRYASDQAGIYAFSRIDARDQVEYLVVANNATTPQTATFGTFTPGGHFRSIYPQRGVGLDADGEARVTVTVPPLSVSVLKATGKLSPSKAAATPSFATPTANGTVGGRAEIRAIVPGGGFNQVSYAWRPAGTTDWQLLGTDDNAPYRVFHDVTGLAKGSLVEYAAVVRDNSGHTSATVTAAIVGDPATGGGGGNGGGGEPVVQPADVSAPGSFNSEVGCSGDWLPDCPQVQLARDQNDDVWKGTFTLPAGDYEYKAAINKSWDENYGAGGARGGSNITFTAGAAPVRFFYDHATHWITTDAQGPIATAAGSFQSELGCPADWSPDCLRSWLQDPDGDGTYSFTTSRIPAGSYEVAVVHGLSWDENYGEGGAPGGANIAFTVGDGAAVTLSYRLSSHVLTVTTGRPGPKPDLTQAKAQWLQRGLIAWDLPADAQNYTFRLYSAPEGGLALDAEAILNGTSIPLAVDPGGLPADVQERWPHLAALGALRLSGKDARDQRLLARMLRGQVGIAAFDDLGRLYDATGIQLPGVLDDLYSGARDRTLGATFGRGGPTFAVWAPTAQQVGLKLVPAGSTQETTVPMKRDDDGVWTRSGGQGWNGARYRFVVQVYAPSTGKVETNEVTDPYSVALTTNSAWSVAADLSAPSLVPAGWSRLRKPALSQPEDSAIYELHIRDFSIGDASVPADRRGTYLAFTDPATDGMKHLAALSKAGLNTVHLLPAFDIATIEENRAAQATPNCDLPSYPSDSAEQQACVMAVADSDGFNWGYDPLHYTTPEGSYSTDPDGTQRTLEFRQMVAGLNGAGLRVVMDVVYNHTAASGQAANSILDRVVPGYYQRLSATGTVETSTCCANTASEHAMMEKLMIDSLVTWAKQYKVDGFRFDLMGHHSKQNLLNIRKALDRLNLRKDGVDGKKIFLYGEGWNFGEVADNARFVQATQANMAGTGIATFSDRLRDAVRGGGPFDDDPRIQGFGTGLYTAPNALGGPTDEQRTGALHGMDLIKVGLTGNLAGFRFVNAYGQPVTGADIDYNGSPAGYTADPSEVITYVDAHDNESLFDASVLKLPTDTTAADRVRWNTIALATTALSQGPVLWHAGNDLLRSKSLDRNSYNSGDWFNRIDWTGRQNTFGSGLPPAADNSAKWDYLRPLLADPTIRPTPESMTAASAAAAELLALRFSSPLFRLGDAKLIQQKVSFGPGGPDQTPGLLVMQIDDTVGKDVDRRLSRIVVVFNATRVEQDVPVPAGLTLSPIQANGADPVVRGVTVGSGTAKVPALTVAVLQG